MNAPIKPDPGIYYHTSFAEYLAWDAISNSRLSRAARSLRHFQRGVWKEPTPAMRLGSFVHCGKLEPLAIASRYVVMPAFEHDAENMTKDGESPTSPRSTGYYKRKVKEFTRVNEDKEIVAQHKYDSMLGIVSALAEDERASEWFNEPGFVEVSLAWIDSESGLLCKARCDKVKRDWTRLTDLKTTENALKFPNSIADYGYHRQMAHYGNGIRALTGREAECCLVAVETEPPYCTRSKPLHEEALVVGRQEVRKLLCDIAEARETNNWPGYDSEGSWHLPNWYGNSEPQEVISGGEVINV